MDSKEYKRSRVLYIIEAALEYLIALSVAGSFLAYLTKSLGISDSLTGIISSIITLGCLFQLGSLFIRRARVKRLVILLSVLNQLCFMSLYILPLGKGLSSETKAAIFFVMILVAYFLLNMAFPKKISWFMSLVSDTQRGGFTAIKEIVSLIVGMLFSFGMGQVVDHFDRVGNPRGVFITGGITIFVLMIGHTFTMVYSIEPVSKNHPTPRIKEGIARVLGDKNMRAVALLFMLYYMSNAISVPFYYSYQIGELGMSLTMTQLIIIPGTLARVLVSIPMGRFADKKGFAKMLRFCLLMMVLGYACIVFTTPAIKHSGLIGFLLYYIFTSIASAGTSSATTNLVFDYVPLEERADALAITQALGGTAGFLATLVFSPLFSFIQRNEFYLFGLPIYAQQVLSVVAIIAMLLTTLYLHRALIQRKNK